MKRALFFFASLLFVLPGSCAVEGEVEAFEADWASLRGHEPAPEWFRDAKFGIYFHWGVYSVPAFGSEWYPRNMHAKGSGVNRHHLGKYGDPTKFGYHDFVPMFRAERFDADEWADLFVKAGARFAGPVAEHHDGFAMWASELTPWNAGAKGPKRDITGELERAIRARGMKFVATFHHARNSLWQKQGRWTGHYDQLRANYPSILDDPERAILYGYMPREEFLEMWKGKLFEVIDNYRPDLIWFDSWLNEIPDEYKTAFLAHYFNRAREWGRDVVVTFKQRDLPRTIGVEDFEKGRADKLTEHCWLTDDTISRGSWCYTEGLRIKSADEVLDVLLDIVSKNGQLLLNISPKADGTIPEEQRRVLLAVGEWLARFGESVYETRPWIVYGEGPKRMQSGGHFVRMKGGYGAEDVRYTRKGGYVYATLLGWPGPKKEVVLRSFARDAWEGDLGVLGVTVLGSQEAIPWELRDDGLAFTTPSSAPHELAVVARIETRGEARAAVPRIRFTDGRARLDAAEAQLHGDLKTEAKDAGETNIGYWDSPDDWASWEVAFPGAGTYEVSVRYASVEDAAFTVQLGKDRLDCTVKATGAWDRFVTTSPGTIVLQEGGGRKVSVRSTDPDSWRAINLSFVELRRE